MNKLELRMSKLESEAFSEDEPGSMIVQFVEPGIRRELTKLKAVNEEFIWERVAGETEDDFIERAKREALKALDILPNCSLLLIGAEQLGEVVSS